MIEIKTLSPKNYILISPGEIYIDKLGKPINLSTHEECVCEIKTSEFLNGKYKTLQKYKAKVERFFEMKTKGKCYAANSCLSYITETVLPIL